MALWGVLVLAHLSGWLPWHLHWVDWMGINAMALMGALDDRLDLRARHKAMVGLAVATLMAAEASWTLYHTVSYVNFLYLQIPTFPVLTFPFLFFWLWSIPQAYNLIDGVNGLSMGLGLLLLGVLGWHQGVQPVFLWGALISAFLLNFPRAIHFLGDCGAMMLGTLFAILSIRVLVPTNANLPLWVFAYPIVDVSMVVAIRAWNGHPLGRADRSHLHHWMMDHLNNRAWLATPMLLLLAVLPMLRATGLPGTRSLSLAGGGCLLLLAAKAFRDRTRQKGVSSKRLSPARRNINFITTADAPASTGSQRAS
jgi:UDP-GlcNAc:undecaprenyl-phosphate GlcNAc-1-phosphate transferase